MLVHELEADVIFGLHRLDEGRPQGPHSLGVALGGVDALFFRCQSSACTARPIMATLTAGPPSAATHTHNSSKVASGCWRRQAPSSTRAAEQRGGAAAVSQRGHQSACPLALAQLFDKRNRHTEPGRDGGVRGTGLGTSRRYPLPQIVRISGGGLI